MGLGKQDEREPAGDEAASCPLVSPLMGRVPGVLAFLAAFAAAFVQPLFFGLAGALLATISLLISPSGCRSLGTFGLVAAVGGGLLGIGHIL